MNQNIRIAKELVALARSLVSSDNYSVRTAGRMITADTTLEKYRETQEKLNDLKKEKQDWDDRLEKARKVVEQFKNDIESGVFQVGGADQKMIESNKKIYLKKCKTPKTGGYIEYDFADKHKDYALAKDIYKSFFDLEFYLKEPEKLQRKINDYENKLQFMKKDVEGALRLRDNLPPEFEQALQNVYNTILEDCKVKKENDIRKVEEKLRNTWNILIDRDTYKSIHVYPMDYKFLKEIDFSKYSSPDEAIKACEDYVKPYEARANALNGNIEGLEEYAKEIKGKIIRVGSNYNGDASKLIEDIEYSKNTTIKHLKEWYEQYRNSFSKSLESTKNRNTEAEAMFFYTSMKDRFVDDLSRYCSEIISVESAEVGIKGNIDAYVTAPNGRFKVQAVPAGGYNIQRYHYRVLINRLKG